MPLPESADPRDWKAAHDLRRRMDVASTNAASHLAEMQDVPWWQFLNRRRCLRRACWEARSYKRYQAMLWKGEDDALR